MRETNNSFSFPISRVQGRLAPAKHLLPQNLFLFSKTTRKDTLLKRRASMVPGMRSEPNRAFPHRFPVFSCCVPQHGPTQFVKEAHTCPAPTGSDPKRQPPGQDFGPN